MQPGIPEQAVAAQLHGAVTEHEDVAGLEIQVQEAKAVEMAEALRHLDGHF